MSARHRQLTAPWLQRTSAAVVFLLLALLAPASPGAQTRARSVEPAAKPWFGVPLPPKRGEVPAVLVGDRGTRPALVPAGETTCREFDGKGIRADLETIVGFSDESRATKEVGTGQLWGRISGLPSSTKTVSWAAEQFRQAGIKNVAVQTVNQDPQANVVARILGVQALGKCSVWSRDCRRDSGVGHAAWS